MNRPERETKMTTDTQTKAKTFAEMFETRTRDNGETFVTLKDGSPEWATDIVQEAHGDMLPDDYRYQWIRDAAEQIVAAAEDGNYDLDDAATEFADATDVYTSDLLKWAASHQLRVSYCDSAEDHGLHEPTAGIEARLSAGQYLERREVFDAVRNGLSEED